MAAGRPTAALPVSQTKMTSAAQQVGVLRYEVLQTTGALLLGPFDDQLQIDRYLDHRERAGQPGARLMLPLQSAAPRPYQRPSTSVSWNGGVRHAASSRGG